jgi:diacylglycerol O-acyltransferase
LDKIYTHTPSNSILPFFHYYYISTMSDTRLSGLDTLFLKAEHPRRLMTVTSIWTFNHHPDPKPVYKVLDTLCADYPRFAKIPRHEGFFRTASWVAPIDWHPRKNVIFHTLKEPTKEALLKYCTEQVSIIMI